jgi:hypothetical protein
MIRSFLLDHEIEAHVLHENAGHLWAGAVADCVLAVHETDLDFLDEAFSAPRETLTDESQLPDSDLPEQDSAPLRFGWDFFFRAALTGVVFVWSFALLYLPFLFLDSFLKETRPYDSPLLEINLGDIITLTICGFVVGLCWAVAILAARLLRPDEHGKFSINARCFIFLILCFTYNPILPILWYLRFSFR